MELGGLLVAESIELHNNSIQSPIPTSLCDNTFPLGELGVLTSDCAAAAGVEPLVECSCCTQCYQTYYVARLERLESFVLLVAAGIKFDSIHSVGP